MATQIHNIKKIIDLCKGVNKKNINEIVKSYSPKSGYIYCLYNKMFCSYGEKVYKCGNSQNPIQRLSAYTTGYLEPSEFKIISKKVFDKNFAEVLLFLFLDKYRISTAREFFDCDIEIIKDVFKQVENIFEKYNTAELLVKHLLNKNKYLEYCNLKSKPFINNEIDSINDDEIDSVNDDEIDYNIGNKIDSSKNRENKKIIRQNNTKTLNSLIYKCLTENYSQVLSKEVENNDMLSEKQIKILKEKMNTLIWLEKILNIKRLDVNNIKMENIEDIKKILYENTDKLNVIYMNDCSNKKILEVVNNKIKKIKNLNSLQKFMADYYNKMYDGIITIKRKGIRKNNNVKIHYLFSYNDLK
jgi:hypothetical protein